MNDLDGATDVADVFWRIAAPLRPQSFLDVGTGTNGVVGLHHWRQLKGRRAALDICELKRQPAGWEEIVADGRDILKIFGEKSFDIVQACCFIEHLTKEDGECFLRDAVRVAHRGVLLFTPLGFQPSPAAERDPHNPYQRHLSGWTLDDFARHSFSAVTWGSTFIIAWHIASE